MPLRWPIAADETPAPGTQEPPPAQSAAPPPPQEVFSTYAAPPAAPVPLDLQVPWNWLDVVLLALIFFFGTFAVGYLLIRAAPALGFDVSQLRTSSSEQSFFLIISQLAISAIVLAYLAAQMRLRFGAPFWRTIGWRKLPAGHMPTGVAVVGYVFSGFTLAVLVQLASAAVGTKAKLPIEVFFQDRRSALLLMLMGVLVAPVFEETIFRGYLYPVVARTFGETTGIFATGVLFGLLHAPQLKGGWGQIGLLMVVGIVFTYARATKKSVLASYLLHVSYNSFLFLEFIASSGLQHIPGR